MKDLLKRVLEAFDELHMNWRDEFEILEPEQHKRYNALYEELEAALGAPAPAGYSDEQLDAAVDAWFDAGNMDLPGTNRKDRLRLRMKAVITALAAPEHAAPKPVSDLSQQQGNTRSSAAVGAAPPSVSPQAAAELVKRLREDNSCYQPTFYKTANECLAADACSCDQKLHREAAAAIEAGQRPTADGADWAIGQSGEVMSNDELKDAIQAAWKLVYQTGVAHDHYRSTQDHYKALLKEQERRAFGAPRPSAQVADAWLIEKADGSKKVVLSPLTDDTCLFEGDEAIALFRRPDAIS